MSDETIIDSAKDLLNKPGVDNSQELKNYCGALELLRAPLLVLRCKLQRELYEKREQLRMPNYKYDPKDKDTPRYTDFDRRTMLEAQTAEINVRYELVKGLEELVKERVGLIKILLGGAHA